jgi:hypothetical protein
MEENLTKVQFTEVGGGCGVGKHTGASAPRSNSPHPLPCLKKEERKSFEEVHLAEAVVQQTPATKLWPPNREINLLPCP